MGIHFINRQAACSFICLSLHMVCLVIIYMAWHWGFRGSWKDVGLPQMPAMLDFPWQEGQKYSIHSVTPRDAKWLWEPVLLRLFVHTLQWHLETSVWRTYKMALSYQVSWETEPCLDSALRLSAWHCPQFLNAKWHRGCLLSLLRRRHHIWCPLSFVIFLTHSWIQKVNFGTTNPLFWSLTTILPVTLGLQCNRLLCGSLKEEQTFVLPCNTVVM